jgi:hypothetical protein
MRRPGIRSLAGGAAGIAAGVIGGIALSALPAAGLEPAAGAPIIDATHVPPALTLPAEAVRLRYAILCTPRPDGEPCDGQGDLFVRAGQTGAFERIPLQRGDDSSEGRYYADVPFRGDFSYYAVLRDRTTGASVTVPSGGAAAPQRSFLLRDAITVDLGAHVFGRTRRPGARVVDAAWGSERGRVGRAGTRELGFVGPASFDVEPDGTVTVLDQVNGRVERWGKGVAETVPVEVSGGLADFAVEPDGTFDVLEPPNRVSAAPVLRSFRKDGTPKWTQALSDRTWAKLGVGPSGPVVQQQPSEEWLPATENGHPLGRAAQAARGRPGKPVLGGREVVVERVEEGELRLAELAGNAVIRAWRVTSATPLGEVQLAEPLGARLVVVLKMYTDERAEYVVLVLGSTGLEQRFSVEPAEWAESAPLTRFRLARASLYQLGSTPTGAFVDRFDLEVSP